MRITFTTLILLSFLHVASGQYHVYESTYNEINQVVARTSDRGFIAAALEFCYTPEEWVIEGCPVGIHLIRTDEHGDTLWTNEIVNPDVQGFLHVFERRDGTFTLITAQDSTFSCHEWIIDPFVGLLQIVVYHLSATGELLSQSSFPDDCHLQLITAQAVSDSTYVVLARYSEPFASDTVEGHLYILDHEGRVLRSHVLHDEPMHKAAIMIDTQENILLFFVDRDSVVRLQQYDASLNLLQDHVNTQVNSTCLEAEDMRASAVLSDSGRVFVVCDNPFGKSENLEINVFDLELHLIAQARYTLPLAADFIVNDEQELLILSQFRTKEDSSDIKIAYFDHSADSLTERHFRIPGNQTPSDILALDGENFAIAGGHNCCNLNLEDGPGKTFLYLGEQATMLPDVAAVEAHMIVFPNPAYDYISVYIDDVAATDRYALTVYAITGERLISTEVDGAADIPIGTLPDGFYLLSLKSSGGLSRHASFFKTKK